MRIRRAIISVSEKMGVVDFAKALAKMDVEILSTGGTAKILADNGVDVVEIDKFTGSPEMLDGRVKTLHPKVHGGILSVRDDPEHRRQMEANGVVDIDLIAVNLYPFEATVAKPDVTLEDAIENIDIGGPTMLRSAAKNYRYVTVVTDHGDYSAVIESMRANDGATTEELRFSLAKKVFARTAQYDTTISAWLEAYGK
jgi:phosphoribosylaminoimidazolecarboxamide formyltransferase/IMP cyclohydrolase